VGYLVVAINLASFRMPFPSRSPNVREPEGKRLSTSLTLALQASVYLVGGDVKEIEENNKLRFRLARI